MSASRSSQVWWLLSCTALLGLVSLFAYAPLFSVDLFWLLKLGEQIAATHAIPDTDLFSAVHPDRPYIQFQWLWELTAFLVYELGGLRALRFMQVLFLLGTFVVLGRLSLRELKSRSLAFAFCAFSLVLFEDRFQARPSATVLGFLTLALPWMLQLREAARKELWKLALLACLWSNVHGGEVLLLVVCMGALAVGTTVQWRLGAASSAQARAAWYFALAAGVGALASPTFVPGLTSWFGTIMPQLRSGNREWEPSYTMLRYGLTPSHVLVGLGPSMMTLIYMYEQWRGADRARCYARMPEWLLCGGLLAISQQAVRNAFLCLVPLLFLLRRAAIESWSPRRARLAAMLGASLLLAAFHDHVIEGYGGLPELAVALPLDLAPDAFPEELATFMQEAGIEGAILNDGRAGGYLAWKTWPRCRIFVDSRHDLTAEMWPVFLASQDPAERPRAMNYAFRRWGLELTVFRGPTFPVVRPDPAWQLLYKAGEQELYQHRTGEHATENMKRARNWLRARSGWAEQSADLSTLATEVGARQWLAAPYRSFRLAQARASIASPVREEQLAGLRGEAGLLYSGGLYEGALLLLDRQLRLAPSDATALYRAAMASYAVGARDDARRHLARLHNTAELSVHQRARLRILSAELAH